MCRSIKTLRPPYVESVEDEDLRAAALQYVRKVSGFRAPSPANAEAFARSPRSPPRPATCWATCGSAPASAAWRATLKATMAPDQHEDHRKGPVAHLVSVRIHQRYCPGQARPRACFQVTLVPVCRTERW